MLHVDSDCKETTAELENSSPIKLDESELVNDASANSSDEDNSIDGDIHDDDNGEPAAKALKLSND